MTKEQAYEEFIYAQKVYRLMDRFETYLAHKGFNGRHFERRAGGSITHWTVDVFDNEFDTIKDALEEYGFEVHPYQGGRRDEVLGDVCVVITTGDHPSLLQYS